MIQQRRCVDVAVMSVDAMSVMSDVMPVVTDAVLVMSKSEVLVQHASVIDVKLTRIGHLQGTGHLLPQVRCLRCQHALVNGCPSAYPV